MDLFSLDGQLESHQLPLEGANVIYYPHFIPEKEASQLYKRLLEQTNWQQDDIKLFGKVYAQPRLTALYGESGKPYSYSGITMNPLPFTKDLKEIKTRIENISKEEFTTVLLNLYRDGSDSNGWHSDDEKELGNHPVIASVSLGAKRCFHLKHKRDKKNKYKIFLNHGSLLLMTGETQHNWLHQLPKSKKIMDGRINLTYRKVI